MSTFRPFFRFASTGLALAASLWLSACAAPDTQAPTTTETTAATPATTAASASGAVRTGSQRLRLGDTGIRCVRAPCPSRGLVPAQADGTAHPDAAPVWAGDQLPSVLGEPGARARVERAWADGRCLLIEGQINRGQQLVVDKVLGQCPDVDPRRDTP